MYGFGSGGLMRIELADAFCIVGGAQVGVNPGRKIGPLGFAGGILAHGGENFAMGVAGDEGFENLGDAPESAGRAGRLLW